ncbi:MAG: YfhO family protein [Bacteroidota bacterium]
MSRTPRAPRSKKRAPRTASQTPRLAPPNGWDRLSSAAQHAVCLGFLTVVALAFFAPVHFGGLMVEPVDVSNWRAMAESAYAHEATAEEPALWVPNAFGGMPAYLIHYEEVAPQLDDVPRFFRAVFGLFPVQYLIVLFAGMYGLVVFMTRTPLAGVLAALAYGLTTYLPVIFIAGHNTKLIAMCMAPWMVWAFAYALRHPSLLAGLLFAMAAAVNIRAEHIQITYYVSFLLGVWWIAEGIAAARKGTLAQFGRSTGALALGSVLALLMVAQPLLSTLEYKDFSIRGAASGGEAGAGGLAWNYAMAWSQGVGELVTLFMADAYGGSGGTYWGPKVFTAGPHYVGGVVLLLAVLALWRGGRVAVWGLGAGAFLMVLFALGEHFEALNRLMFNVFPLFDAFRVPETWLSIVALGLAILAALGLAAAVRPDPSAEEAARTTRAVYGASGLTVGAALVLFALQGALFDFQRTNEGDLIAQQVVQQYQQQQPGLTVDNPQVQQVARQEVARRVEERQDRFNGDALRTLFMVLLAGGLLVAARRGLIPSWVMQLGLVLLVTFDLYGVGKRYFAEERLSPQRDVETLVQRYDVDAYLEARYEEAGSPGAFRVLNLEGNAPWENARPAFHYQTLNGYHGAKLRLYQDFLDHLLADEQTVLNQNALRLMNTRYVVATGLLPGYEVAYRSEQTPLVVLEDPAPLPRAFFAGSVETAETPQAAWDRLKAQSFNPATTALIYPGVDVTTTALDSTSTATATLTTYTARDIVLEVETDAPRLLVLSEVYYPAGWTATLNDTEVPIHRVNHLLRGVEVPAGRHTLTLRFAPSSHTRGAWISLASTALVYGGVLVLLGLAWTRRRSASSAPPEEGTPEALHDEPQAD